jgi:hypothetical protein
VPSQRPSSVAPRPPDGPPMPHLHRACPGPGGSLGALSPADHGGGSRELALHRPFLLPHRRPPPAPMLASSAPPALQPRRSPVGHLFCVVVIPCMAVPSPIADTVHLCAGLHLYVVAPTIGNRCPRACTKHSTRQVGDCGPTEEMKQGGASIFLALALAFCSRDQVFRLLLI